MKITVECDEALDSLDSAVIAKRLRAAAKEAMWNEQYYLAKTAVEDALNQEAAQTYDEISVLAFLIGLVEGWLSAHGET